MRYHLGVIFFIISNALYGQNTAKKSPLATIENNPYFHNYNIENFYLHTNKSLYFTEEQVFFKAYVVTEANNKPNLDTKNLHVNLYDFNNKLVLSKLFYTKNGVSSGSIALPKDLKSGEYTIQLDTQWNKNFKEGSNFTIEIHNLKDPNRILSFLDSEEMDDIENEDVEQKETIITFFPESGSLLNNVENTIYFNVKSRNEVQITGKIVDTNTGQEVAKIENINSTSAKSTFNYNSNYVAVFNIDGITQQLQLPQANPTGFILSKTDSKQDNIVNFKLRTNTKTLATTVNKFTYAVLHQKGVVNSTAPFNLSENILTYNLNFIKTDLFQGLNTISVFDSQNRLVTERSFYNQGEKKGDILTSIIKQDKDSITLDLSLVNINKATNISISVLHEDSDVFDYKSKITNSLLYQESDFNTAEDHDLYFQKPQPNSSFVYHARTKQKLPFTKEYGLKLIGKLNKAVKKTKNYQVTIVASANELFTSTKLNTDNTFKFEKLYLTHPSEYTLLLMNKKGKSEEARFYIYSLNINYHPNKILKNKSITTNKKRKNLIYQNGNTDIFFPIAKNIEHLDEVILENVRDKRERKIKEIKKENPFLAINAGFSRDYLIDPEKDHQTLEQYLRTKVSGVRVRNNFVYSIRRSGMNRGPNLIKINLDGITVSQTIGLIAPNQPVSNFELISINPSGLGGGITSENGVLNLISRKGKSIYSTKHVSKTYKTITGFEEQNEKITDIKLFYPNKKSEHLFSTIDWIPNFNLNPNTTNILKIKKPMGEHVKLIINGFSLDGDLIYKIIEL
ncbi:hypothetical protein [Olleya sp. Bg11-27]|uniref:hypothetical protein n=1 Tax=Olleya sp. Bg11-27 TaxID=2058135 RepID=UPI000C308036|nr:hypothetical protein [Olleya sp. Bg11-27]AUC76094.1 hypothetical protein CW732_10640 [Olleya sp. Bg11-27]